jgi:hypothetical protein
MFSRRQVVPRPQETVESEKESEMAMVNVMPTEVTVACDLFTGRPRSIRTGVDTFPVVRIERVRQEAAAYPAEAGPRTVFTVRTPQSVLRLTFRHRDRRWVVDGLDLDPEALPSAA